MIGPGPDDDAARDVFERTRRDADRMLARDGEPESFSVWFLGQVRRHADRYLRYAVLDGVMAAMDDDEVRRG